MKCNRFPDRDYRHSVEHEACTPVVELCCKHGVSDASTDKWKAKFGGIDISEPKLLTTLDGENTKLNGSRHMRSSTTEANRHCLQ